MSLPMQPNNKMDVYHKASPPPPAAPAIAAAPIFMRPAVQGGLEAAEAGLGLIYTHIIDCDPGLDIRDAYLGAGVTGIEDNVWVPDKTKTCFKVMRVVLMNQGTATEFKRLFVDRVLITWPSNSV